MHVISVVPIFMSAGAAVLPTIIAAVTSVAAVLFKPRELVRICRDRPIVPVATVLGALTLSGGIWWLMSATPAKAGQGDALVASGSFPMASPVEWDKVARKIIDRQKLGNVGSVAQASRSDSALMLGRDFTRCAYDGGPAPLGLLPYWSYAKDNPMILSMPVVGGRRVFAAGSRETPIGMTGFITSLDVESGNPLWNTSMLKVSADEQEPLKPFFSSPALTRDGASIVVGQGLHQHEDCALLCFNADDGQLRWAVKTPLHIESSPAIWNDVAVAGCGAIEGKDGKPTGDPGHVLAVRISDGKELWRQPVNDPESSPAIDAEDGTVYIGSGFNGSALVALRIAPDDELKAKHLDRIAWRTPVAYPLTSAITLVDDLVIAGGGNSDFVYANPNPRGMVVAVDRKTGAIRWQCDLSDAVLGGVSARDGKLICPCRNGEVIALDQATGKVLWHTPISGKAPVLAGCAFTGRYVYAVSSDGYLAVLDATDGKALERVALNDPGKPGVRGLSLCTPQVVGGRVYVGSETGGLRCFVAAAAAGTPGPSATNPTTTPTSGSLSR